MAGLIVRVDWLELQLRHSVRCKWFDCSYVGFWRRGGDSTSRKSGTQQDRVIAGSSPFLYCIKIGIIQSFFGFLVEISTGNTPAVYVSMSSDIARNMN